MFDGENIKCVTLNYRDDVSMEWEEWHKLLEYDMEEECKVRMWDPRPTLTSDLSNGREVEANGHFYQYRTEVQASTAKDILSVYLNEGDYDELFDALDKADEAVIQGVIKYMTSIKKCPKTGIYKIEM